MVRVGSVLLSLSVVLFVISTGLLHPHGQDPMDARAAFREYAER